MINDFVTFLLLSSHQEDLDPRFPFVSPLWGGLDHCLLPFPE